MRHHSLPIGIFAIASSLLAGATSAQAANETWVSRTGTDTGTCPRTAPCKTFAFAHDQTNNNGAINVLSSGNFGPLTITKPISIVAEGVEAVINTSADGAGIIIQAGAAAVVSLRGLTIDLRGTDNIGISFVSGAALHVQNCIIRKTAGGIKFAPASGTRELYVADSVIANADNGIDVAPTGSGSAAVILERVRAQGNGSHGFLFQGALTSGSIAATVRNSVSAGNASSGILANGASDVIVDRSVLVSNLNGVIALPGATIRIGNSTVSGNATGLFANGSGVIASYGTNKLNGNGTDISGTITPINTN